MSCEPQKHPECLESTSLNPYNTVEGVGLLSHFKNEVSGFGEVSQLGLDPTACKGHYHLDPLTANSGPAAHYPSEVKCTLQTIKHEANVCAVNAVKISFLVFLNFVNTVLYLGS